MPPSPRLTAISLCGLAFAGVVPALAARKPVEPPVSYEKDVRPVLKAYCFDCHGGGEKLEGGLDLRLKRFIEKGGDSGHALVPKNPGKSLLVQRLKSGDMPPVGKKVPPEQIAIIEKWIAAGAPTLRVEPQQLSAGMDITPDERAYWFYQPIRTPAVPQFKAADRVRTPIDAFVLRKLQAKGLSFAPDADRLTLVRRVALDLTGLPPTPEETDAFVNDTAPGSYERMVDRFLASPHWLDVAGYADSDGNGSDDTPRAYAYKYRDYVIRSLNADKPFNQFITEQVAGDELVPRPWANLKPEQIETLTATGFLRTAVDGTGADPANTNQVVGDTLKIVSSSLLGLTVGCAQCHDHRYDPIPQSDYYRLRAVFEPALDPSHWRAPGQRLISLYTDAQRAQAAAVEAEAQKLQAAFAEKQARFVAAALENELQQFPADQRELLRAALNTPADKRTVEQKLLVANNPKLLISPGVLYQYNQKAADELTADQNRINAKRGERPAEDFISILSEEPGIVPVTKIFYRGDHRDPKQAVAPGDLTIAAPEGERLDLPEKDPNLPTTGRRLAWARHLMDGRHPLVGRVLANRVWLNHFGRGLVDTPGDFGKLGVKPTHPQLLDYLASAFASGEAASSADANDASKSKSKSKSKSRIGAAAGSDPGSSPTSNAQHPTPNTPWSLKGLHRLIMCSTVYRQASGADAAKRKVDSDGSLYSRFPVRRLDAEALRDRILVAAGRLDRTQFGPPVPIVEDNVGQISAKDDAPRRSVYLQMRRSKPISFL
ncbi:MAG: Planctomycete cytochrome, partial [Armatimonadetes bacterium]|nr:Planctomycete cytochrome [Armatimonadota bacterium]